MGSSYSDINLYFNDDNTKNGDDKYSVTTTRGYFSECINFIKITYKIEFTNLGNPLTYNVVIYNGYNKKEKYDRMFGYYYPSNPNEVIKEVHIYCSIFAPNVPLVISFVRPGNTYNCKYTNLHNAGWDHAYNITKYTSSDPLKTLLENEYKQLYREKTIEFKIGRTDEKDLLYQEHQIDKEGLERHIYSPIGKECTFGNENLFDKFKNKPPKTPSVKNYLDTSYLSSVTGDFFDGIVVYNKNNIALLLEFFRSCTKKQIVRKDKNGTYWVDESVSYTDDSSLKAKLDSINSESSNNDIETYMLDRTDKYNDVTVNPDKQKTTYSKYTHAAQESKKPNILFKKSQVKKFGTHSPPDKTKTLDVYYLTVKGDKEKKQDDTPFLIIFNENGSEPKTGKVYHFKNTEKFEDWEEFKSPEKLDTKLNEIETNEKCVSELPLLRKMAYDILTKDKPPGPPEPTPPPTPGPRPPVDQPTQPVHLTDWNLFIILGVTGVVVLGLIAATIYGIYWYNTTIKLLT